MRTSRPRPFLGLVIVVRPPKNTKGHWNPKNVAGPSPAPGSRSVGAACLSHRLQHARLEYGRRGGQWDGPHAGVSPADVLCSRVVPQAECRTQRTCGRCMRWPPGMPTRRGGGRDLVQYGTPLCPRILRHKGMRMWETVLPIAEPSIPLDVDVRHRRFKGRTCVVRLRALCVCVCGGRGEGGWCCGQRRLASSGPPLPYHRQSRCSRCRSDLPLHCCEVEVSVAVTKSVVFWGFRSELDFFFVRDRRLKDRCKEPCTANHQPPPTTTNRHQLPVANRQPPIATNRQPPIATNRQPPIATNHR